MTGYSKTKSKEKSKKNNKNKRLSTNTGGEGEIMDETTTFEEDNIEEVEVNHNAYVKVEAQINMVNLGKIDRADVNTIEDVDM